MKIDKELYLEMWLSEQIPTADWIKILEERKDVRKLYYDLTGGTNAQDRSKTLG